MDCKKKEQYLVLANGQKKIIIPMSDISDIFYDERIIIQGIQEKPYVIMFNDKTSWGAPLDDKTIQRFRKFKENDEK